VPPEFIWQSAHSLMSPRHPRGQPTAGEMWYGRWSGCLPNHSVLDRVIEEVTPLMRKSVADARLRERIAELPALDAIDLF
jgi:hypothetical protein